MQFMAFPVAILAAGRGKRLSPLTDDRPKCLLPIGDTCPLGLILDAVEGAPSVSEIFIVVGHEKERIASYVAARRGLGRSLRLIENPRYDTVNNILSADLLRPHCGDGLLLVNSDILCHPDVFRAATTAGDNALVIDPARPPREEAMKVRFERGRLAAIAKTLDPSTADGEYIGIARFDRVGAAAFFTATGAMLAAGRTDEWYEAAIEVAARDVPFGAVSTAGKPWIEIDDACDLDEARTRVLPKIVTSNGP